MDTEGGRRNHSLGDYATADVYARETVEGGESHFLMEARACLVVNLGRTLRAG